MLRRLVLGLVKGGLVGGLMSALLVFGWGVSTLAGFGGYLVVVLTGALVALVAGKPIWAQGAWVEVLLKAVAAALLALGGFYLMQRYLPTPQNLQLLGTGALGALPAFVLPTLATLLAVLFEVDNTGDDAEPNSPAVRQRVENAALEAAEPDADDVETSAQPDAERRSTRAGS